jgi:acetyl esterase/lipase
MPLDRHAKRLLEMIAAGKGDTGTELTPESMRRSMTRLAEAADVRSVPIGGIEDHEVSGPGGPIRIRIYTPCDVDAGLLPCIVYFHGGTGVFCGIGTHDGLCRLLASSSGCKVISSDYRLAPEHPFPAAIEDGAYVTHWVAEHAADLEVDPERLVVAGDSAGGTIAAVICQLATLGGGPRIALQALLCPVTDLAEEAESRRAFAEGFFIERSTLEWAKSMYCAGTDLTDPRISPLRAKSLVGLPPAHVHTAEFDPMRDEGEAYAKALAAAGVPVRYTCHAGLIHHFYCMAGAIPTGRAALASVGAAIRNALSAASPSCYGSLRSEEFDV